MKNERRGKKKRAYVCFCESQIMKDAGPAENMTTRSNFPETQVPRCSAQAQENKKTKRTRQPENKSRHTGLGESPGKWGTWGACQWGNTDSQHLATSTAYTHKQAPQHGRQHEKRTMPSKPQNAQQTCTSGSEKYRLLSSTNDENAQGYVACTNCALSNAAGASRCCFFLCGLW